MRYSESTTFEFIRAVEPGRRLVMTSAFRFVNPNLLSPRLPQHAIVGNEQIDGVAAKVYGAGGERTFYKLLAANAHKILAYRGDSEKIGSLVVPPQDLYP
jgi:hypothetical protein